MSNTTTIQTPFALAFGKEAVALIEIRHNTLRISKYSEGSNAEGLSLNLDLIEKVRYEASVNANA